MLVPQMLHAIGDGGDEFDLRRGASVQIFFHQGQLPKKTIILLLASLSLPERLRADTAPSWPHMIIAMVALKLAGRLSSIAWRCRREPRLGLVLLLISGRLMRLSRRMLTGR